MEKLLNNNNNIATKIMLEAKTAEAIKVLKVIKEVQEEVIEEKRADT